ncbi:tail assembly chaperone [Arthrobacter phage Atuin]|nr:tail assembly chaperone [Arthrobacter phage Atuin]
MASRKIKSFAAPSAKEEAPVEPIVFELAGTEIEAYGEVSGAVLLDFIANSNGDNSGDTAKAILAYLKDSMDAENFTKFDSIIRDPKTLIKIETLSEIVAYLVEERASRPTAAS